MSDRRQLDFISYKCLIFTTNEQNLCSTYRELIGNVSPLTKYEQIKNGSDQFINVLNDYKPILSFFLRKETFLRILTLQKCN